MTTIASEAEIMHLPQETLESIWKDVNPISTEFNMRELTSFIKQVLIYTVEYVPPSTLSATNLSVTKEKVFPVTGRQNSFSLRQVLNILNSIPNTDGKI
jgi:hypothetical protein